MAERKSAPESHTASPTRMEIMIRFSERFVSACLLVWFLVKSMAIIPVNPAQLRHLGPSAPRMACLLAENPPKGGCERHLPTEDREKCARYLPHGNAAYCKHVKPVFEQVKPLQKVPGNCGFIGDGQFRLHALWRPVCHRRCGLRSGSRDFAAPGSALQGSNTAERPTAGRSQNRVNCKASGLCSIRSVRTGHLFRKEGG